MHLFIILWPDRVEWRTDDGRTGACPYFGVDPMERMAEVVLQLQPDTSEMRDQRGGGRQMPHTPGPWRVVSNASGLQVFNDPELGHAEPLAALSYQPSHLQTPTSQANARLIAAAPDLLAAAEETISVYDSSVGMLPIRERKALENLRAAIRRARGEE